MKILLATIRLRQRHRSHRLPIPLATNRPSRRPAQCRRPARERCGRCQSPRRRSRELPRPTWSGYWNPAITTGPDGRATISLTLPDDATNLTLVAKAITPDTRAGQVSQNLVLKKDLSAVIHLPPAFTDGDEVELPVVVQNQVLDRGTLEVALNVNVDGHSWNEKKIFEVKSRGRLETSFKTTIRQLQRPAQEGGCLPVQPQAVFTVTVKAGKESDVCRRSVPVLPYGTPCRVTATGLASGEATVTIAPSRRHWTAPTLQIAVSPSIQRSLLDMLAPAVGNALRGVPYSDDPADAIVRHGGPSRGQRFDGWRWPWRSSTRPTARKDACSTSGSAPR